MYGERVSVKQIAHSLMSTKNRIVIHQLCYMAAIYEHQSKSAASCARLSDVIFVAHLCIILYL